VIVVGFVVSGLATLTAMLVAWGRARQALPGAPERRAWALVQCGLAGAAALVLVAGAWWLLDGPDRGDGPAWLAVVAGALPVAALGATHWGRVLRHVDELARVAAVLVASAVAVVVALGVAVLVLGRLPARSERALVGPAAAAVAVTALVAAPLQRRAAAAVSTAVGDGRRSATEVVRTFTDRTSRGTPDEELLLELAVALRAELRLDAAEVWIAVPGGVELAASTPRRPRTTVALAPAEHDVLSRSGVVGASWLGLWVPPLLVGRGDRAVRAVPACSAGELLGLVVAELAPDADLGTDDDAALAELGRRLGVVLHARRLDAALALTLEELRRANDELRASRARLVAAADAARHRIERDLHDGAQQQLVSLAVTLRLARDALDDDPADARRLLADLADDARAAIQQLRDLAHGIYPPLLADAGLAEALRAAASRAAQPVRVVADGIGRHPADVEAAVYFCCLEALQNAAKHAPGATVDVDLSMGPDGLRFVIADDGPGFDPVLAGAGHGLQHMADRVGAIGGQVTWDAEPGRGTTVRGHVPAPAIERAP
jgi:signal transduction histidine kinase